MRKKGRSNIYRITGKICFALAILAFVTPGCKKKEVAPLPSTVSVKPLPKRGGQPDTPPAQAAGVPAPAATSQATMPKPAAASPLKGAAPAPAAGLIPVQKQISSSRLAPAPKAANLDFSNRRDPFRPFVEVAPTPQSNAGKGVKPEKDALPIQRFDVDKFRISGIITGVKENSALVLDPNGKGYVVKAGMLLGNNSGRIKRITDSSLDVEENFRDDNGKVKKRLVKLMLIRKK